MKRLWLPVVLACGIGPALAGTTAAGDPGAPYVAVRLTRLSAVSATDMDRPATLRATEQQLSAGLGGLRLGRDEAGIGIDYQYTRYEYDGIDSRNRDLHRLQLPLRLRGTRGRWQFDAFVAPGVSTSSNVFKEPLDRWRSDDVTLAAGIEGQYPLAANVHWLAGVVRDRAFGSARIVPVAGVLYAPGTALSLRLAYPDSELSFAPSDRQRLVVRVYPAGHRWHVVSDTLLREFDYRVRGTRTDLTWSYRLWRAVSIDLSAGVESGRRHRFVDDRGSVVHAAAGDQWLLSVGFSAGPAPLPRTHGPRR